MRILAVDPGFARIGIAILEKQNNKETLLYSTCFKTSPEDSFPQRLLATGNEVERAIKKFKPEALAIEMLFFHTNQKTAMNVAEARGVIIYEAVSKGIDVYEYTPLQIKTAITGYGRASKQQIASMVGKLIDIKETNKKLDDEFDAIAIGLTHFAYMKNSPPQ